MLKGAQKRMIVVKTADSKIFEEAYFVVTPNYDGEELDMIAEAERIASSVIDSRKNIKTGKPDKKNLIFGICGGAMGVFVGVILSFIFKFPL